MKGTGLTFESWDYQPTSSTVEQSPTWGRCPTTCRPQGSSSRPHLFLQLVTRPSSQSRPQKSRGQPWLDQTRDRGRSWRRGRGGFQGLRSRGGGRLHPRQRKLAERNGLGGRSGGVGCKYREYRMKRNFQIRSQMMEYAVRDCRQRRDEMVRSDEILGIGLCGMGLLLGLRFKLFVGWVESSLLVFPPCRNDDQRAERWIGGQTDVRVKVNLRSQHRRINRENGRRGRNGSLKRTADRETPMVWRPQQG